MTFCPEKKRSPKGHLTFTSVKLEVWRPADEGHYKQLQDNARTRTVEEREQVYSQAIPFLVQLLELAPDQKEMASHCMFDMNAVLVSDLTGNVGEEGKFQCPIYGCELSTRKYKDLRKHMVEHRKSLLADRTWNAEGYTPEALGEKEKGITAENIERVQAFKPESCKRKGVKRYSTLEMEGRFETTETFCDRVWHNLQCENAKALWVARMRASNAFNEWKGTAREILQYTDYEYLKQHVALRLIYKEDGTKMGVEEFITTFKENSKRRIEKDHANTQRWADYRADQAEAQRRDESERYSIGSRSSNDKRYDNQRRYK